MLDPKLIRFRQYMIVATAICVSFSSYATAQTTFVTTQLVPEKELIKLKDIILKDTTTKVQTETAPTLAKRLPEDLSAKQGSVHVLGALAPELMGKTGLMSLNSVIAPSGTLGSRNFYKDALREGLAGGKQIMIPWMHTSFFIVVNKKALPYLPAGANTSELTYEQFIEWGKTIKTAQAGQSRIGLPVGNGGLIQRFIQGYAYPSYTGTIVRDFRSPAALKMWEDLRALWAVTHPESIKFDSMSDALIKEQVWIAFDHAARLFPALNEKPADFIVLPAPVGPKGRGFFYVLAGLSIPANTPDQAASIKLIEHLTSAETQAITFRETGFFPVVSNARSELLSPGQRSVQVGAMAALGQAFSTRALVSPIPVTLGAQGGKFNDVYRNAFSRIAVNGESADKVLAELQVTLNAVLKEANVPCWGLDARAIGSTLATPAVTKLATPLAKNSVCSAL